MKSNTNVTIFLLVALASGLLIGLLGGLAGGFMLAKAPAAAAPPPELVVETNVQESSTHEERLTGESSPVKQRVKADFNIKNWLNCESPNIKREYLDLGDGVELLHSVLKNQNGQNELRMAFILCDREIVLTTAWQKSEKSSVGYTLARNYWKDGHPFLGESDEDGDGFFESMVLMDKIHPVQVFDLTTDGKIQPIDKKRLKQMRKVAKFMEENFTPIVEGACKGIPKEELKKQIEEAAEKAVNFKPSTDDKP